MAWWHSIYPQTLIRSSSPFNQDIRVVEEFGKRKLLVNGSRQSGPYIEKLWKTAFSAFAIDSSESIHKILILGVGGGTVINMLNELYPSASILAIDIDPVIIEISKRYFAMDSLKQLTLKEADAEVFIRKNRERFDMIVVDLFSGRIIPDFVSEASFLEHIHSALNPKGILLLNFLRELEYKEKSGNLLDKLAKIFQSINDREIFRNRFFLARK